MSKIKIVRVFLIDVDDIAGRPLSKIWVGRLVSGFNAILENHTLSGPKYVISPFLAQKSQNRLHPGTAAVGIKI